MLERQNSTPTSTTPEIDLIVADDTDTNSDASMITAAESTENKGCFSSSGWGKLLWSAPIGNALYTAFQMWIFLRQAGYSLPYSAISGIAITLTSLGLDKKLTIEATDEVFAMLKSIKTTGNLPDSWPKLSRQRERIALAIAIMTGVISAFYCGAQAYYFVNVDAPDYFGFKSGSDNSTLSIPTAEPAAEPVYPGIITFLGHLLSALVPLLAILNKLVGQALPTYINIRKLLAKDIHFYNTFSAIFSTGVGGLLGAWGAIVNAFSNFIGTVQALKDSYKPPYVWMLASGMLADAVADMGSDLVLLIQSFDDFFSSLGKKKRPAAKDCIAFTMTGLLALFLAPGLFDQTNTTMLEAPDELHVNGSSSITYSAYAITTGYTVDQLLLILVTLYPLSSVIVNKTGQVGERLYQLAHNATSYIKESRPYQWIANLWRKQNSSDQNNDIETLMHLMESSDDSDDIELNILGTDKKYTLEQLAAIFSENINNNNGNDEHVVAPSVPDFARNTRLVSNAPLSQAIDSFFHRSIIVPVPAPARAIPAKTASI